MSGRLKGQNNADRITVLSPTVTLKDLGKSNPLRMAQH
jgi:hypothetical protein